MWKRTRKPLAILVAVLVLAFIAIQFVPVDRSNPSVTMDVSEDVSVSADVTAVLREFCYDCHSNETTWPWYSYVAPVSWQVAQHVHMGRAHLNFSMWDTYSPEVREHHLEEIYEEASEGKMPLANYLWMHKDAVLTQEDLATLSAWINQAETSLNTDDR